MDGVLQPSNVADARGLDVPSGWSVDCRAPDCAAALVDFYNNLSEFLLWDDAPIDAPVDLGAFDRSRCDEQATPPDKCVFEGDFDGDGAAEPLAWVRQESTNRFDMIVGWKDRQPTFVGWGAWGHVNAARHLRSCAESLWESAGAYGDAGELSLTSLSIGEGRPRDAFVVSRHGRRHTLWFDGRYWRTVQLREDESMPDLRVWPGEPWSGEPPPVGPRQCSAAKTIRRNAYRARNEKVMLWFEARKVARDACMYDLDLDGDEKKERASWVVVDGKTGLRVDWSDGRVEVLGAGRKTPIDVLEGEPGCNLVLESFDQSWDIAVANWTGTEWRLPDSRTQVPLEPGRIEGDALAITNTNGHVDLVFRVDGEWRTSAVPFSWRTYHVFWPAQNQWNWVHRPTPELERYRRPSAVSREWARIETPGPPPESRRFFAGK